MSSWSILSSCSFSIIWFWLKLYFWINLRFITFNNFRFFNNPTFKIWLDQIFITKILLFGLGYFHFWLDQYFILRKVISWSNNKIFRLNEMFCFKIHLILTNFKIVYMYFIINFNYSWSAFFGCFFDFIFVNWLKPNKIFLCQLICLLFQKIKI